MELTKKRIILAAAVVLAVLSGVFVYFTTAGGLSEKNENLVSVPVPKRNIYVFEIVQKEDLELKNIPQDSLLPGAARTVEEVAGKVAVKPLSKGQQISLRDVSSNKAEIYGGRYIVAVNMDYVRAAGVQPGDIVDVYWVNKEQASWVPGSESSTFLVARNAKVVSVRGKTSFLSSRAENNKNESLSSVVELAVRPEEAPKLLGGAMPQDTHIVFVKKFKEDKGVDVSAPSKQQKETGSKERQQSEQ